MLILYALPASAFCAKVRIVLRYKGLEWKELPPPGGYRTAEYKQHVVSGNLPALIDDGFLIADSEAIVEYLEEKHPTRALLPADLQDRARMRERGRFHDTRLEPQLRALFAHILPNDRDTDLNARQSQALTERLGQLAVMLGEDDLAFGLGDVGFPATCAWIDALTPVLGLTVVWPRRVRDYLARLGQVPAVATEMQGIRAAIDAWFQAKGLA
ncbi:MAG: glutathione S-transferase family protein [Gemmobacter sp.]|nr:glutathione S-transferase family protein [Gemmobacter sp.]